MQAYFASLNVKFASQILPLPYQHCGKDFCGGSESPPYGVKLLKTSRASNGKSVLTPRAYNRVLPFCSRKPQHRSAGGTFAIDVRFAVATLISHQPEEIAKPLVFRAALLNVS